MEEVKDILNAKQDEAKKDASDYKEEEEKQVVLDKMFAGILNSWLKATGGKND